MNAPTVTTRDGESHATPDVGQGGVGTTQANPAADPGSTGAAAQGARPRAITIAMLAMGGEGGGVLADWLVDLAEQNGYLAQTTSVPGVAQRTGATIYYIEMFPERALPAGAEPVFSLSPVPGEVDIVIASELMEAGRALQRGLVTADRTTLIASSHRVYSMTERTAMGDERVDSAKLLAGARAAARQFVVADFARLAEEAGSPIAPALYGALAATGRLPFDRAQFEATITRGGVGVKASLAALAAGFLAASEAPMSPTADPAPPVPRVGHKLTALSARIRHEFPAGAQVFLHAGILRTADYQDVAYAKAYLDRMAALLPGMRAQTPAGLLLLNETARYLALWMSYEDTVRVADLKTRRSRFERVGGEVRITSKQHLGIHEFLHPRIEEIADTLPAGLGRWLLKTRWARACVAPFCRHGRVVQTSSVRGYLLLYAVAALRGTRRASLRFQVEQQRIHAWLGTLDRLARHHADLAVEVARAQRLVKGYGETHSRGWRSFERVMAMLPLLENQPQGASQLQALVKAALADDTGRALETMLTTLRQPAAAA